MEDVVDLLPLSEDPAALLWLENEVLDLDLFGIPLLDAEDEDAAPYSASPSTSIDSQTEKEDGSSSSDDLRVVLRFKKPMNSSMSTKAAAKAPTGRATHRQRQKQDIQTLRAHVAELQHELRFLQSAGPRVKQETSASTAESASIPSGPSWQLVAKQQFQVRESAEEENRRLRQTLQERIGMAKSLERVLLQHEMIRSNPKPYYPRKIPRNHFTAARAMPGPWDSNWITVNTFHDSDVRVFHELLAHVEDSAGDLDAVFKANGLDLMTSEFCDARLKLSPAVELTTGLPGMAIEMLDVKILPFDLEETARVVWRCVSSKRVPISRTSGIPWQKYTGLVASEDVVAMRSDEPEILLHRVMKRFVDPGSGRISFVWESHMRLKDSGTRVRQRGWVQFERQTTATGPATLVRSSMYVDPRSDFNETDTLRSEQRAHFAKIADRILPNFELAISTTFNTVHTQLIEESQAHRALP